MGCDTPKQFIPLRGLPIIMHTINLFRGLAPSPHIIVVLPANQMGTWEALCREYAFRVPHGLAEGGTTRFHSVRNGLDLLSGSGLVAIHDAVRPLVSPEVIERCYAAASEKGNAIPVVTPTDSVRMGTSQSSRHVDRECVWQVQTPQVFPISSIKRFYQCDWNECFTDDASVAEMQGEVINLVQGNRENIKITTPSDLLMAEALMGVKG